MSAVVEAVPCTAPRGSALEVLRAFAKLGLTSFGGPVAHLGYFRAEFVGRRKWLDETAYADIVALCQFLPGPASSQVGISLGVMRAGLPGALAAWFGFTIPSALVLILFGYGVTEFGDLSGAAWLHGLKIVAVAKNDDREPFAGKALDEGAEACRRAGVPCPWATIVTIQEPSVAIFRWRAIFPLRAAWDLHGRERSLHLTCTE